ncbi:Hypothetical_protein [Hexamita inflata]|uniref:Hypothetical_protein n=1 Tax=Hexamita inflata TaxID=28002 RepID=A0AA86N595_9EUKA|nr:Hypothetical protein HINF_LOCUS897 [Hexamita inflata]
MESQKLEKYSSYSKENNLNHFDTEVQRTAQAAQSSAKKTQTNNDEIVIEIELEDTLNRISQNETWNESIQGTRDILNVCRLTQVHLKHLYNNSNLKIKTIMHQREHKK